jgi:hypothetical protein
LHSRGFQLRNITTWIKYTEGALWVYVKITTIIS